MKKWLEIIGFSILVILFIYLVGTKPNNSQNKETAMNITGSKKWDNPPEMQIDVNKKYFVTLVTSQGNIRAEMFAKEAPQTVNNFIFLAKQGFYDNVIFHRIMKGFMVQTGDPTGTGMGGPGYKFADETNDKTYDRGTFAMANSGPNTNGSQFFIMHQKNDLPKDYTIFGSINSSDQASLSVLDKIAQTPVTASQTGENSIPTEKVFIISTQVEEE